MNKTRMILLLSFFSLFLLLFIFIPIKQAFTFTELRTEKENIFYVPLGKEMEFQIRYVHSIHLTDVIETYEVTKDSNLRLLSMTYENLGIGLPGSAGEGEKISLENGKYTLTYDDNVIESFNMFVGNIDADLAFRYGREELNLKKQLERGKSYTFRVQKLSYFQMLKGAKMNVKK